VIPFLLCDQSAHAN